MCSMPTHRSLLGHDNPYRAGPSMAKVQAADPPVGSADRRTSPSVGLIWRATTQKPVTRHVSAVTGRVASKRLVFQAAAPPVGLVELIKFPALSPATQRL